MLPVWALVSVLAVKAIGPLRPATSARPMAAVVRFLVARGIAGATRRAAAAKTPDTTMTTRSQGT
jgi:hypothetical protein